jgi:hypothetical protein
MFASLYSIFFCYDLILLTCFCIVHTGANCVDGENNVVKVENIGALEVDRLSVLSGNGEIRFVTDCR